MEGQYLIQELFAKNACTLNIKKVTLVKAM